MDDLIGEIVHFELVGATGLDSQSKPIVIYDNDGGVRTLKSRERLVITDIQVSCANVIQVTVYAGVGASAAAGESLFVGWGGAGPSVNGGPAGSALYSKPGVTPLVSANGAGAVTLVGSGVIINAGVGDLLSPRLSQVPFVYGDRDVARTMFNGSIVRFLDMGDSFVAQASFEFPYMFPIPCGGVIQTCYGQAFIGGTCGTTVDVGAGVTGVVSGVYTPPIQSAEFTFNGVAPPGGGLTNGDRIIDFGFTNLTVRNGSNFWHREFDWLSGRKGTFSGINIGTGNDATNLVYAIRKTSVQVSSPLAITGLVPASAKGQAQVVSVPLDATSVGIAESCSVVLLWGNGVAAANGKNFCLHTMTVELDPSYAPFLVYYNVGINGAMVNWITDPARNGQLALASWVALAKFTHARINSGLNETGTATQIATDTRAVIAQLRSQSPNLKIILECAACVDETYRARLINVNAAFKQVALDTPGVLFTSMYEKFNDPVVIAPLISAFHPTAAGRSFFHAHAINMYIGAAAST